MDSTIIQAQIDTINARIVLAEKQQTLLLLQLNNQLSQLQAQLLKAQNG